MSVNTAEIEANLANESVLFLDVRTAAELSEGIIEGKNFLNIPHSEVGAKFQLDAAGFEAEFSKVKPAKDSLIIVYCAHGRRGGIATSALQDLGYNAKNVPGGITKWTAEHK